MAQCEMCGKAAAAVVIDVEGSNLSVCPSCSGYGTVTKNFSVTSSLQRYSYTKETPEWSVVSDYASQIRRSRERKGMSHDDFSKLLQERETVISKWEAGTLKPSVDTARRLERILGIKLVQEDVIEKSAVTTTTKSDELTLGDFVKIRKR
ncbi:MAG: multiprotein bridging factor aMBF1 [Nanoarchaeota archaeon]|nr:multiprotein bridging factor aMBF1 [Nanoarchaeota archaeon]